VLVIVQNLPVPLDRRVWLECLALRDAGYDVSVICPKGPGDPPFAVLEGIRLHKYRPAPPARTAASFAYEFAYCWLMAAVRTWGIFLRRGLDAVQACNPPDTYWALALTLKPFGVRFVYDQHDLCPEVYRSRFARDTGTLLRGLYLLERLTYGTADHVIATNESYRAVALRRGGKATDDVTIVRNGPDPERLRPVPADPAVKRGRTYLCCYLGIMGPQDGVDIVLHAADVLVHDMGRDDVGFALLGFGDSLDGLRALCTRLRLDDHVTFTGRADDAMICRYLSSADVGLSPDPKDPFNDISTMNKTMEYMAFGLPVVAFDLTETRVSAGAAATYVEHDDAASYAKAIAELLDEEDRRARMGEVGSRRIAGELAWGYQRERYVAVYDRLLRASRRDAR
jgi:glycosyltransferase involved in cell wall biosynthesis